MNVIQIYSFYFSSYKHLLVLDLIYSTSVMKNPNSNQTCYKTERCTERVCWADVLTYKYTSVCSLSEILIKREKNLSLLSKIEKKRDMIPC
jgi:hypothetical protein